MRVNDAARMEARREHLVSPAEGTIGPEQRGQSAEAERTDRTR